MDVNRLGSPGAAASTAGVISAATDGSNRLPDAGSVGAAATVVGAPTATVLGTTEGLTASALPEVRCCASRTVRYTPTPPMPRAPATTTTSSSIRHGLTRRANTTGPP